MLCNGKSNHKNAQWLLLTILILITRTHLEVFAKIESDRQVYL